MTVFDRTWDATYETEPADTENVSQGAGRIRNLKVDIRERMSVDHRWAGTVDDGQHNQVTMQPLNADPGGIVGEAVGILYTKLVGANTELFFFDTASGTILQLTSGGTLNLGSSFFSSPTFSGTVTAAVLEISGSNSFRMWMNAGAPQIDFDSVNGAAIQFNAGASRFDFYVGGSLVGHIP